MHKKFLLLLFLLTFFSLSDVFSWSYPVKEISRPIGKCKFELWENLGPTCKVTVPALKPDDYKTKKSDTYYRRIFTVLWASTYKYGWDMMQGTHLGVDIASSAGTPVYTIGDGKVVYVGIQSGRGKVVVVRHKFKGKYIFSNYAHLSKIVVVNGQEIKEGQKIGEIGNTGNSFGNHLHFQIDTNQDSGNHPFWFRRCGKLKRISSIVNSTECISEVVQNTIDPIEFLATNGASVDFIPQTKEKIKSHKIDRKGILSNEEIQRKLLDDFLRNYEFSFIFSNAGSYNVGDYGTFNITLKDKSGKIFTNILPDSLKIIYDDSFFSAVYPRSLDIVDGTRKVSFKTKKSGITFFTAKLGENTVFQKMIRITKPGSFVNIARGRLLTTSNKKYLGVSNWGVGVFQDAAYLNVLKTPFDGTFRLVAGDGLKVCKGPNSSKLLKNFECKLGNFSSSFNFTYSDTLQGILLFKFYGNSSKQSSIKILNSKGETMAEMKILTRNIKLTHSNSDYKNEINQACSRTLCFELIDKGFVRSDDFMNRVNTKHLIRNFLHILGKNVDVNISYLDYSTKITRAEFVNLIFIFANLKIRDYSKDNTNYLDISNSNLKTQNQAKYLERLGFFRKDKFAKTYFQPNSNITVSEALYLVNFLASKYTN